MIDSLLAPHPLSVIAPLAPAGFVPASDRAALLAPSAAGPQRVGDAQRDEVHALLGQALAMGYLDSAEFDARTDATLRAVTGADLAGVTSDLPVAELRRCDPVQRAALARTARIGVRIHVAAFALVTLVLTTVWLAAPLGTGAWYPWPVWPTLGWAIGVASHAIPVHYAFKHHPRRT